MDTLLVHGGTRLKGAINISGSKNASLPILAATLLTEETVIISRVPDVSDTNYMLQILSALGAEVERSSGTVRIKCANIIPDAPYELVRRMRASICVMGPLLARLNRATVSLPGGCVIGDRPVDLHIKGLAALGAECDVEGGNMDLKGPTGGLIGCELDLRGKHGPTVLGTDNIMMAACLAKGTTIIESAACEPEVVDLANFLISMGAKIEGAGTRRITIEGVEKLGGTEHTVIADRIEAGTFMAGAAAYSEGVTLNRVVEEDLAAATKVLRNCGHSVEFSNNGTSVTVTPGENPVGAQITTAPYPGFPTDMQAQFSALFATTPGLSVIEDTIFPQRFMHCAELSRMGANINVDNGTAVVTGVKQLSGAPVMASDLRASAALVLAALSAKGTTAIHRLYHIDRGYENIDEKLLLLGAQVERVRGEVELEGHPFNYRSLEDENSVRAPFCSPSLDCGLEVSLRSSTRRNRILNTHRGPNGEAILAQDYNDSLGEPYTTFLFIKREGESHWESHQLDFEDSRWPNPGQMVERNNRLEIFKESQLFASYHYRTETLFLAENGVNYQGLGHSHNEDWNPTVHYPTLFSSLSKKKKHPKPLLHN